MNDSRPRTRKGSARRSRKVQKTFTALLTEPEEAPLPLEVPQSSFPTVVHITSFPYRAALANWPDEWRERWGRRANELEDEGLSWRDAEARAFVEVQHERRAEVGMQPIPLTMSIVDRN